MTDAPRPLVLITAGGTGGRGRGAPAATTAMSRGIRMIHCAAYVAGAEARP